MKLGTLKYFAIAALTGSIVASVAASREPAPTPPAPAPSSTQGTPAKKSDNLSEVLEMFRSDLNANKVRTLNQVMKMTAEEAAKFWPIYQKYEKELAAVGDRRVALIRQFVQLSNEGKLTDSSAAMMSEEWLQGEQDRLNLWKKYNKEIGAAVSPIRAAQFLQVEHQIALLVDINIASAMPAVGQPK